MRLVNVGFPLFYPYELPFRNVPAQVVALRRIAAMI